MLYKLTYIRVAAYTRIHKMLSYTVHLTLAFKPSTCKCVCVCVDQLLRRNPERRLGSGEKDAEEVKKQPFFKVRTDSRSSS